MQNGNYLYLVHRIGLVQQAYKCFREKLSHLKLTMLGGGYKIIPKQGIVVSTIQTLHNCLENKRIETLTFLKKCDAVFIDEMHLNSARQVTEIMSHCSASMRIGLSGTISRKNKVKYLHYMGLTGPILAEIKNKQLVDLGRSAKPFIRFIKITEPEVEGNYRESYQQGIVEHPTRNRMIVKEIIRHLNRDRRVMVTVSRRMHGRVLLEMLRKKIDVPCQFIQGSTALHFREEAIKKFESGKAPVLIISSIGDVGMDLPAIDSWVNAAAGKGWELILQRLGRTLRKKKGENKVYISEFLDMHNDYLRKHSKRRLKTYRNENIAKIRIIE